MPTLDPDYTNIIIPPNIAPLNFSVKEPGRRYLIKVKSKNGAFIEVNSSNAKVQIPIKAWKKLLSQNKGEQLIFEIYIQNFNNKWKKYKSIENKIANEEIDSYVAYRLIHPASNLWDIMGELK